MAKVAVIVGSLRKDSFNRKMAENLIGLAPKSLTLTIVEISGLSLYNQDLEDNPPAGWVEFRNQIRAFDGVLFVTPEYNRSIPGVLKNAIDIGSRPPAQNIWDGKPGAIVSVTPGSLGALAANQHLRLSLSAVNIPVMPKPEAYIGGADKLFDKEDNIIPESTREHMKKFMLAFAEWINRNAKPSSGVPL